MSNIEDTQRALETLDKIRREHWTHWTGTEHREYCEALTAIRTALAGNASAGGGEAATLARQFHDTYERLAPQFGYETRADTKAFDPESPNGKLMIATVRALGVIGGAGGVPAGWKLVPVEPTDDMLVHGQESWLAMWRSKPSIEDCKEAEAVYKAMLTVAPGVVAVGEPE